MAILLSLFDDSAPFIGNLLDTQITTDTSLTARVETGILIGGSVDLFAVDGNGVETLIGSGAPALFTGVAQIEIVNAAQYNGMAIVARFTLGAFQSTSNLMHYTVDTVFAATEISPQTGDLPISEVNTGWQNTPVTAALLGGGYVTVWTVHESQPVVMAQVFNADGSKNGSAFAASGFNDYDGTRPAVIGTADGGFAVAWSGVFGSTVAGFDINNAATFQRSIQSFFDSVTPSYGVQHIKLALLPDGSLGISFAAFELHVGQSVVYTHLSADGNSTLYQTFLPEPDTTASDIAVLPNGNILLTYMREIAFPNQFSEIVTKVMQPNGDEVMSTVAEWPATNSGFVGHNKISVSVLADGGWVVAWVSAGNDTLPDGGSTYGAFFQQYAANGNPTGAIQRASTLGEPAYTDLPEVVALPGGGFIIGFTSGLGDGDDYGFMAQMFDAQGQKVGGLVVLNEETVAGQGLGSIALLTNGTLVASFFTSNLASPEDGPADIRQRLFDLGASYPQVTHADTAAAFTELAAAAPDHDTALLAATGTVDFVDPDPSHVHSVSVTAGGGEYVGLFDAGLVFDSTTGGAGQVVWNFAGTDADIGYLAQGQVVTQTYVITIDDGVGGVVSQTVTVTLTGSNDAPVLTVTDTSGTVTEDAAVVLGNLHAEGVLTAIDPDAADVVSVTVLPWNMVSTTGLPLSPMQINAVMAGFAASTSGWTYDIANAAVNFLGAGDSIVAQFSVEISDGHVTTSERVSLTIHGANDAPTLSVGDGVTFEDSSDFDLFLADGGMVTASDPDSNDAAPIVTLVGGEYNSELLSYTKVGTYGTLTLDSAHHYQFTPDSAAINALKTTMTETFTISATDALGAVTTQDIVITLSGANDRAVVADVSQLLGAVTEAGGVANALHADQGTTFGDIVAQDTDTADAGQVWNAVSNQLGQSGYGRFSIDASGHWTYTLDNSNATVQGRQAAQTLIDTYNFALADGSGFTVAVQINGTNDVAVITGTATGSAVEDNLQLATGDLDASDVDGPADLWVASQIQLDYGLLSINSAGQWTYEVNQVLAQGLGAGETVQERTTVQTVDGAQAEIIVVVTGQNDLAVITGHTTTYIDTSAVDTFATLTGTVLVSADPDAHDTLAFAITGGVQSGAVWTKATTYGVLTLNADTGAYSFVVDQAKANGLGTGANVSAVIAVTVSDGHGAPQSANITINLTGTNDAPIFSNIATLTGSVTERADGAINENLTPLLTATGVLNFTDAERGQTHSVSVTPVATLGGPATSAYLGTLSVGLTNSATSDGVGQVTWTYRVSDALVDKLAAGETMTQTYRVNISDGTNPATPQIVTVTVTGTNDAPVISVGAEDAQRFSAE